MARLVAVCREGEEEHRFHPRQIPLFISDALTMVIEFSDNVLDLSRHHVGTVQVKQFVQYHSMLKPQDLSVSMAVTSREVLSALSQLVPCVGCRRSVERLFSQLVESGNPALEPLTVHPTGVLSLSRTCAADARKLYTLFYVHGSKLNDMIDAIPKSKKNKRCQLHSLDTHKPRPLGGSWMDVWELMSQECRDEVVLIDSACLLETLETYLRKHRFCTDCKNKVLRAYNILVGELDCGKEKGYCAALYEGLRCCPQERHVHVCGETDFIAHLLGRAEPEFAGGYERRERHAKTIDVAQEEVLTCLGIHLYERLHRIWQKLRAEEQTWQMLFYLGVDALRKSFEVAVEKVQGISRLEQLCEELSEEERARELKQEKKRQKRKNRRKNKCEPDADAKDKSLDEGSMESVDGTCKDCGSVEELGVCPEVTCSAAGILGSPKAKKGPSPHCNGSDCGYSSSMEGSEAGSREGSDVACSEGICNHDETGEFSCGHRCSEGKDEDCVDSCVECWANVEDENVKGKNKKKKRKSKPEPCGGGQGCAAGVGRRGNPATVHGTTFALRACRTKAVCSRKGASHLPDPCQGCPAKSLMELLDESEVTSDEDTCLTQDEIQTFVESNKSFMSNRDQYRQNLKDNFTKYCRLNEQRKPSCTREWLPATSVN
ncbi:gametogenetin-binding protein 2 [Denticeps clupeoides]|uniref:Gametogenetin-binding protein 2 n=1 Tax=Denticeps clupeoides TaxID=299321 RepID=A0AAY4EPJ0_9TELE|nr:gametogenetin-binding protein 2 [Denticeps clupeoides]